MDCLRRVLCMFADGHGFEECTVGLEPDAWLTAFGSATVLCILLSLLDACGKVAAGTKHSAALTNTGQATWSQGEHLFGGFCGSCIKAAVYSPLKCMVVLCHFNY